MLLLVLVLVLVLMLMLRLPRISGTIPDDIILLVMDKTGKTKQTVGG